MVPNGRVKSAVALILMAAIAGCETKAGTGAIIGGLGGAALGGAIGSHSHARAGEGAAIGAVGGALAGGLIGHAMDKDDEKKAREAERYRYDDYGSARGGGYSTYSNEPRPAAPAPSRGVTRRDVVEWSDRGVNEHIIIDRIERSGSRIPVTAADENDLRDKGVSEGVIRAMKDTNRR